MTRYEKLRDLVIGAPLDPLSQKTRQHIALAAFLAWVGLGADGLSSSAYGPEEAFRALGAHTHLGLFMAIATAATVFIISLAYNQVIELFPTGGGGYRVATSLIGPRAGLVSGAALIVDYVLTIAISVASGVDALFSLLPMSAGAFKLGTELSLVAVLLVMNLRGMKESIKILLPIFLGFFLTHTFLIAYGILGHTEGLPHVVPDAIEDTRRLAQDIGWVGALSLFLRAYSLGGGTYTGIEAVSNNVQTLREPRVRTGKLTMFYMAVSLAFTAGGIILLYLLWRVQPVEGQTLNAVVFGKIIDSFGMTDGLSHSALWLVLVFEAGLLFVAANTGFLGGPQVLSNMAADSWLPHQFRHLSTRLVTQNGIVIMGLAALVIVLWSRGSVHLLVVLYSINVFLTFTLSLLGLCIYWWRARGKDWRWLHRLAFSGLGLAVTSAILGVTVIEKFGEGGWVTVVITSLVIGLCVAIHRHYDWVKARLKEVDEIFSAAPCAKSANPPPLDPNAPTAAFMVGSSRGGGIHTVLWVQRLFPNHFRNFIFISAKAVDAQSYGGAEQIDRLRTALDRALVFYVDYCHANGLAATARFSLGTDRVDELEKLAEGVQKEYSNCVFFTSKLVFRNENWVTRLLHNQTALALQRRLHLNGMQMVILPMQL
ncbi:MAG TPA: APC family permease [Casimicrobiaceae bacterium]|jgi:amino acid transporter|nr:APC family permease [Casimicrobiaceae bacterium]